VLPISLQWAKQIIEEAKENERYHAAMVKFRPGLSAEVILNVN